MKITAIKIRGLVKNGNLICDHVEIFEMLLKELEGKRFEMLLKKEHVDKTSNQLAYYFGGIIAGTCMRTTMFEGWEKDAIDEHLRYATGHYRNVSFIDRQGKLNLAKEVNRISEYSVDEMTLFIEDVLNYLG